MDIVFVCGKVGEVTNTGPQELAEDLAAWLADQFTLVQSDYRALQEAVAVQAATWRQAERAEVMAT